ncbi:MAG: hypothetical protein U0793_30510 [Gemmataceae bacterium]
MPSGVDEPTGRGDGYPRFVHQIAWSRRRPSHEIEAGLVIAADTVGWLDGQVGRQAEKGPARMTRRI